MFRRKEKNNIKVVLKTNSKENENLETVKKRIYNITEEFNITLSMSQVIDEKIKNSDVVIEYYSKAKADEIIGDNYLKFLDKFLEIGYENGVNTVPME